METRGHYVQLDDNLRGQTVELRFTHASHRGVDRVYQEKIVAGVIADCAIYPVDTIEGRDRLVTHCVSPDMISVR